MATTKKTEEETAVALADARKEISARERFSDAELKAIESYEDALRLVTETYGEVLQVSDKLGNGFALLPDTEKGRLIDIPFLILHSQFSAGEYGEFASMAVMTSRGERLIVNDGSTGICAQLRELVTETGRYGGYAVRGLRSSEYATCPECGKPMTRDLTDCRNCGKTVGEKRSKGTTYYLSTAA